MVVFHAFAHLFGRIFVNWYTFLGTSPGGIGAQVALLVLTEAKGGWWRFQSWRDNWRGGLKRGAQALGAVWAFVFVVCTITTVYNDHATLVARLDASASERATLQAKNRALEQTLKQKQDEINSLKSAPPKTITRVERVPGSGNDERAGAPRKQRLEIRNHLGMLLGNAQAVKTFCLTDPPPQGFSCVKAANEWYARTLKYIGEHLEQSYQPRFLAATGLTVDYYGAKTAQINNVVNNLTFKSAMLEEFIKELRD